MWLTLEQRAEPNFFLSWCWVEAWIKVVNPAFKVLQIYQGKQLVGLGLLTCNHQWRYKCLRSTVLRLGQTGDLLQDQMWIEYNGLLMDAAHINTIPSEVINYLLSDNQWDEFVLGASTEDQLQRYNHPDFAVIEKWTAPVYGVDLDVIRRSGGGYLATLSRNTRYQINRSQRLYQSQGVLTFKVLESTEEMLAAWSQLAALHIAKWGAKSGQSGFVNETFINFHKRLIVTSARQHNVGDGSEDNIGKRVEACVEICCLSLDGHALGFLYNFIYEGTVYFYLSGLSYDGDPKLKPGLLIHSLAIQHYLDSGSTYYDFLGGEARYKQSLGTQNGDLKVLSFQRPRFKLKLEQLARRFRKPKNRM